MSCSELCAALFYREEQITWEVQGLGGSVVGEHHKKLILFLQTPIAVLCCGQDTGILLCTLQPLQHLLDQPRLFWLLVPTLVMSLLFWKQTVNIAQASPHLSVLTLTTSVSYPYFEAFLFP